MLKQSVQMNIDVQPENQDILEKLYRYTGLIEAVDFFSQQLNYDQIIDAAFEFINELLMVEQSVLFYVDSANKCYEKKAVKGCDVKSPVIKLNVSHDNYAKFHGSILKGQEEIIKYFDKDIIESHNVRLVVPFIAEHSLCGFMFITNKTMGELKENDFIIAEVIMKLCNTALNNYKRYDVLQKANLSLDEKIFNLFAINQSSRVLLSELNLNILYNLSIDVFSELTQSGVTGFILYDEKSEKYSLKAYKDIFQETENVWISLSLKEDAVIDENKMIVDVYKEQDKLYFNSIFEEDIDSLYELKPIYLVFIIKNKKILGFVSLSCTVTGTEYKNSVFELIESLASSTFISLSNAQLFYQVSEQKKALQKKLDTMINLNELIKNINSSMRTDILLEMTLKTLNISFGVEKALIALYDKLDDEYNIQTTVGFEMADDVISANWNIDAVFLGKTMVIHSEEKAKQLLQETVSSSLGEIAGVCIVPIYIERIETELLGLIMVFQYKSGGIGEEENILTLESVAGHIAPVLSNLYTLEEQERFLLPNHIELFKKELKKEIYQAEEFSLELEVIEVIDTRDFLFKEETIVDKLNIYFSKIFPFSYNNIFILENELTPDAERFIRQITGVPTLKIKQMVYNVDFHNFTEFFNLF